MGCGCGKNKKRMQSSRMPISIPKQLTPSQRRSERAKKCNAREKAALKKFLPNAKKVQNFQRKRKT